MGYLSSSPNFHRKDRLNQNLSFVWSTRNWQSHSKIESETPNVILDCGGYDSSGFREALLCSDAILIPTRPNQADVESTGEILELIEEANNIRVNERDLDPLHVYIYITQVPTNARITALDDARNAFKEVEDFAKVLDSVNYDRIAYSRAYGMGLGVIELNIGASKAAEEVNALAEELFKWVDVVDYH